MKSSSTLTIVLALVAAPVWGEPVDYSRVVRPILSDHCYACHGPDEAQREAGLQLDSRESAVGRLDSGSVAVVPGRPNESALITRVFAADPDERMPPDGKNPLTDAEKDTLKMWIAEGAPFDSHWAFLPPKHAPLPEVANDSWPRTPIDRFVLARLEAAKIEPSEEADRVTLIRRLSLDLRGLPPTISEVDAFVNDRRPDAYERLVNRLLADPAYGENMATQWLDLARFGDTNGYQDDATRSMWPYRDYVIRSFNANKPFDQFTLENIAGDLLTALSPEERRDQLIGSGFNRNHRFNEEGGSDPEEFRVAYAVDRTNATATTWLGLTFECAQCHDHKYDPISQRDYYQLYAFFNSVQGALGVSKARRQPPVLELPTPKQTARLESLKTEIAAVNAALKTHESESDSRFDRWTLRHDLSADDVDRLVALPAIRHILKLDVKERSNGQNALLQFYFRRHYDPVHRRLTDHRESLRTVKKRIQGAVVTTMIMAKMSTRKPAYILRRGHFTDKGDRVEPNVPAILPPLATGSERDRLALARWLVDGKNPLVARVAVNRLWKQIFGTGIVKTANDFGTRGEPPSHPPLLDWLATELVRCSWDLKTIQRLILTSATYRQAPAGAELGESEQRAVRIDPNNRLLWHSPRYRLVAETIRDNALAIAGLLSRKFGGPSVMPFQPPGYFADKSTDWDWNLSTGNDRYRRGVYTFWRRTTPYPMLTLFDAPSREVCTALRPRTNTPLQALVTMNDPVYVEASRVFAQRVLTAFDAEIDKTLHETLDRALTYAFRTAVSHNPNGEQIAVLRRIYQRQLEHYRQHRSEAEKLTAHGDAPQLDGIAPPMLAAWMCVANVLLNMDETITRE